MKLFLVCNSLGGGGAERVHVNLANGFVHRGHEVYLIADINQDVSYPVDELVHVLPLCPSTSNKLVKWGKAVVWLRKNIKLYKPDVVIGNMHLCSIVSRLSTIGKNIPVVMTIHHALESKDYRFSRIEKFLDRYSVPIYSSTILLTKADRTIMNHKYKHRRNIFVIPNPLTFTPIKDNESISGSLKKERYILAAGRLDAWKYKGWDLLIQTAGLLKSILIKKGWKIKIAGDGTEKTKDFLYDLCRKEGVEDVIEFLGYRTDIKELMLGASIFCLSSRSEGLPMVLIEAMSQGCAPVACENFGRTKEIITNENEGLLYKTADYNDLAVKLTKMMEDDAYREKVQHHVIRRSGYYLIDNVIVIWEQMLSQIVGQQFMNG